MTHNGKALELCKCCDIIFSCDRPCQDAIEFEPIPKDCYIKGKVEAKGIGPAWLKIDGELAGTRKKAARNKAANSKQ